jgi:hypothetical protein
MGQPTQDTTKRVKFSRRSIVRLSDFTCIQYPHPFGVLPVGNRFFGEASATLIRRREEIFDDKVWQHVLSYCDGSSLGRTVQVSRYLYVAGHQSELWRDLVLRKCHANKSVISRMGRCWRDTYILLFHGKEKFVELQPMKTGIYSDSVYRSHLCRSFALPSAWLDAANVGVDERSDREVPSIPVDKMPASDFFSRYEECNHPVIVQGAALGKAVEMWCDWEHLHRQNTSSKTFRTTSGAAPLPGNFTLRAYQKYTQFDYLEESPLYLFDRNAFASNQQWEDDFFPEFYKKCPYWDPSGEFGHDLLQHLGSQERPDHTWLIVGPKRSGSVFHIDPNCTHAWNACIQGRKRWIFYPPGDPPPGVLPSPDGDEVALPISVGEWIVQYWPEHMEQYHKRPVGLRPMECTTFPGDVIFVPHVSVSLLIEKMVFLVRSNYNTNSCRLILCIWQGWWHSVINLEDVNIAITHNYLSPSNLGNALKFFVEKQDQISGCRDRAESIKPERIYDALVKVLMDKEPYILEKALAQREWTCRAWSRPYVKESRSRSNEHANPEDAAVLGKRKFKESASIHVYTQTEGKKSILEKAEGVEPFSFSFL